MYIGVVVLCMVGFVIGGIAHVSADHSGDDIDPFAEAGLDQEAETGQTVLLDGAGSWSSEGNIGEYRWVIETPDGTNSTPACSDCDRTEFVPEQTGEYAVELTVTDEHGNTDTDTMYVSVESEQTLEVSISGDTTPVVDEEASYTGTIESTQTSINTVEWRLDGTVVEPDEGEKLRLTETFSSPEDHTIELVVTDDSGQVADDELVVSVRDNSRPSGPSVSLDGDQLVTGERPLKGEYQLAGHDAESVDSIRWYADGEVIDTGTRTTEEWEPGTHQLYATLEHDGDTHRATFPDGNEVVADPTPEIELDVERTADTVTGTAVATDEFGSLDTVSVYVGDEEIVSTTLEPGTDRSQHEETFSTTLPDDGSETPIRAVAVDDREQVATDSTQRGQPELVSAEFVNTPVDSYHERIDEERYTAIHEMVIELNGEEPGDVSSDISIRPANSEIMEIDAQAVNYDPVQDRAKVRSTWAAERPGDYEVDIFWERDGIYDSEFSVEPSPPEVHVDIIDPGQDSHDRGYKLLLDANNSFDPDGSSLRFLVADRDRVLEDPSRIGIEFDDTPELIVEDFYDHSTSYQLDLYDFYTPEIDSISEVSEGPYASGDVVVFDVNTEGYQIAAPKYDLNTDLQIENGQGSVESWRVIDPDPSAEDPHDPTRRDPIKHYTGQVAVEIESFADGEHPVLTVSNTANPDGSSNSHQLPEIEGIMPEPRNADVTDIEYTVDGFESERTATSPNERVVLERSGYQVYDSSTDTEAIELEKRHTETTRLTETQTFDRESTRDGFISTRHAWADGGTDSKSKKTRETEWVESMDDSSGRYTGETRTVSKYPPQVSSPTTVTEYKFELTVQETVDLYVAEKVVEEMTTRWKSLGETENVGSARGRANSNHDIRVASTSRTTTWDLSKVVHETKTVDSYDDPTRVQATTGTVSGDIIGQTRTSSGYTMQDSMIDEFSVDVTVSGPRSESELIKATTNPESSFDPNCNSEHEGVC